MNSKNTLERTFFFKVFELKDIIVVTIRKKNAARYKKRDKFFFPLPAEDSMGT